MTSARTGDYLLVVPQHITRGQCTALPGVSCRRAVTIARPLGRRALARRGLGTGVGTPVSVVLGTAGKALFALRHLLGPAVTPTKGVRRPLEHFRALPAHGPRNAG